MEELVALGHARQVTERFGKQTRTYWRVSAEGHRILGEVMARNGRRAAEWNRSRTAATD